MIPMFARRFLTSQAPKLNRLYRARLPRLRPTAERALTASPPESIADPPTLPQSCFLDATVGAWYPPTLIPPGTIGALACQVASIKQVSSILLNLEPDEYTRYLLAYYDAGLSRFGHHWRYADITTVLLAASQLLLPERYLEIGVRRGRSMAVVASIRPDCELLGFDLWQDRYAGMSNPGPEFVARELRRVGHRGSLRLLSGDSHHLVPAYFQEHPGDYFDLITVDGDHSRAGAEQDLVDVLPRLKLGGVIVFDDIASQHHPYLIDVWRQLVVNDRRFATWEFSDLGYGVALAVRRW